MNVIYKGIVHNLEAEHAVLGGIDLFIVEHPETGLKTKITQFYVDENMKPLHPVCPHQNNCTQCLCSRKNVNDDSCVYGKYSGYPTEYFIRY